MGSTAFTKPHRPIPQPVVQTPVNPQATQPQPVIPGRNVESSSGPSAIGKMLLEKDGWLQKHVEEEKKPISNASVNRGGLGYQKSSKSMYHSMILQGDSFLNAISKR